MSSKEVSYDILRPSFLKRCGRLHGRGELSIHQRCIAAVCFGINMGAHLQKHFYNVSMIRFGRVHKRCHASLVSTINYGTSL